MQLLNVTPSQNERTQKNIVTHKYSLKIKRFGTCSYDI